MSLCSTAASKRIKKLAFSASNLQVQKAFVLAAMCTGYARKWYSLCSLRAKMWVLWWCWWWWWRSFIDFLFSQNHICVENLPTILSSLSCYLFAAVPFNYIPNNVTCIDKSIALQIYYLSRPSTAADAQLPKGLVGNASQHPSVNSSSCF